MTSENKDNGESINTNKQTEQSLVKQIPRTSAGLLAQRINQKAVNLHDQVEQIVTDLVTNDTFYGFIDAVYPEQAVEGSIAADNHEAARMVREYAKENGYPVVAHQKIQTLIRSLNVVLRRYGLARNQRLSDSK